jgi:NADH-quinone oxidoreductase subunit A
MDYDDFVQRFSIYQSGRKSDDFDKARVRYEKRCEELEPKAYLPILLMFIVAAGFAVTNIILTQFIGQRKQTRTKLMPYECGKDPVGSARERFSIKFYLIAMIFILFDIEVIFLVPWAVVFKRLAGPEFNLSTLAYVEMMLFVALLLIGYIYVLKKGAFDWGERARREAEAEGRALEDARRKNAREEVANAARRAA